MLTKSLLLCPSNKNQLKITFQKKLNLLHNFPNYTETKQNIVQKAQSVAGHQPYIKPHSQLNIAGDTSNSIQPLERPRSVVSVVPSIIP
eukprot:UN16751